MALSFSAKALALLLSSTAIPAGPPFGVAVSSALAQAVTAGTLGSEYLEAAQLLISDLGADTDRFLAHAPLREVLTLALIFASVADPRTAAQQLDYATGTTRLLCLDVERAMSDEMHRPEATPYTIVTLEPPALCRMPTCFNRARYGLTVPHLAPLGGTILYPICASCVAVVQHTRSILDSQLRLIWSLYQHPGAQLL